ncbi:porin [Trinickia soli]|uniref:Porin n=1 Tax=Trinickia soli TaxID=380675 RepID=A0A2N7W0K4_9BURK|nr:porin [Trinickia soli]PMS22934.1 porin [Trinickia soli]CAB3683199.1 Outer membrane porin protein 32 [Trinickia soli]
MKKALLAAALMSAGVIAHAQSSVTLYGRVDAGIEYMTGIPNAAGGGSSSRFRAESGDWGTSLWGLKGVEDLGGGNQAVFKLENGFNLMNGQLQSSLFNRWATVGLSNANYGTLTMGRMLYIANGVWDFDPFGQSSWSSASLVRGRNWPQSSNNIAYQSPKWNGFDIYGQYALSNATNWNGNNANGQGREAGLQLTYTNSLFQVRGIYDEIRDPANGQLNGTVAAGGNPANTGAYNYSREYTAAVNVFLGQFKLQGAYQAIRTSGINAQVAGVPSTLDHEWGGVTWQATPAAAAIAAVYHVNGNNGAGNATIYTIGGTYNLSKRTLLDIQIATVRNSKNANFSLEANGVGNADNPLPGHSQSGVYAGIQHSF